MGLMQKGMEKSKNRKKGTEQLRVEMAGAAVAESLSSALSVFRTFVLDCLSTDFIDNMIIFSGASFTVAQSESE